MVAGFYPDPTARFERRYWNGVKWTKQVTNEPGNRPKRMKDPKTDDLRELEPPRPRGSAELEESEPATRTEPAEPALDDAKPGRQGPKDRDSARAKADRQRDGGGSGRQHELLIGLRFAGEERSALHPEVDQDGTGFVLEDGEEAVGEINWGLFTDYHDLSAQGEWQSVMEEPRSKAQLIYTTRRLLVSWPRAKSDRSMGSFTERRIMTKVLEREEGGPSVVGGHLRYSWIEQIAYASPKGLLKKGTNLSVQALGKGYKFRIYLSRYDPDLAPALLEDLGEAMAAARLDGPRKLDDQTRETLDQLRQRSQKPEEISGGARFSIPGAVPIGADVD